MPLYEYRCDECGSLSELLQRIDEPPAETCPDCGGKLRKLISAPAFQFKGSGWYVTDYARGGDKPSGDSGDSGDKAEKGEKKDKSEAAGDKGSGSGKSESKSDGKSDSSAGKSANSSAATPA